MSQAAIEHLEDAEVSIMSWIQKISAEEQTDEAEFMPMLLAVLRHISRAAGILHGEEMYRDVLSPHPPDPRWRCWRGYAPFCSSLDPNAHSPGYGCGIPERPPQEPPDQT